MIVRFVEVTDGFAYGKFAVMRLDAAELALPSAMPDADGALLLTHAGRRRFNDHSTLIADLQRGTAFVWPLAGGVERMEQYESEHFPGIGGLVCPLYRPFVRWLYKRGDLGMGEGSIGSIPRCVHFGVPG